MSEQTLFKPYPKQEEFINAVFSKQYDTLIYGGAMGGGKTYVCLAILIMLCRIYPNSKWTVIRESLPSLKKTVIETFSRIVPSNFLLSFNKSDFTAHFKNGSKIEFMAEDFKNDPDLNRFKSYECNGFFLEQMEELQQATYEMCHIRAGRWKVGSNPPKLILGSINPSPTWVKERFYEKYITGTLPKNVFYLGAKISDNPALYDDKAYMAGFDNLDPTTYARYIDGDWYSYLNDKRFAYSFDERKHVKKDLKYYPELVTYLAFDFNRDPITCIAGQHSWNKIHILKEFRLRNSDIYELCTAIKQYFPEGRFVITGDASGKASSALVRGGLNYYKVIKSELKLKDSNIQVPTVNPSIKNSRVLTNSILAKHPEMLIDESCEFLIQDLKFVEMEEDTGDIDKAKDKHKTHLLDCYRYYLWRWFHNFVKF